MRRVFSRLVVASGLLTLACATALDEGPLNGDIGQETGGSGSAGSLATAGTTSNFSGSSSSAGTPSVSGGTGSNAFGGTGSNAFGGAGGSSKGGSGSSGGAAAGSSSGGKGGSSSAGSGGAAAGSSSGGKAGSGGSASAGSASGGSGTAGSSSTTCNGVPDWTSKAYTTGDTVASTCSGVFAGSCPAGQSHKFECNPMAGAAGLPWCQSREPGVGNGWGEAWVDKAQCQ
jgi:hypothetical protein